MERMLERAVLFAYRKARWLGADPIEAFETALPIVFDARPDLDEGEARAIIAEMLAATPEDMPPPGEGGEQEAHRISR